jgi:hypothetical protein
MFFEMKTNLSIEKVKKCVVETTKKFSTVSSKILLNKGDYRNVALQVEAGEKGSKLAREGSEKLTKNVCDHVLVEFVKQVTKENGWVQMHDGKVFGIPAETKWKESVKHDPNEFFNNDKLCYCNREKPIATKIEVVDKKESNGKSDKPKTLDGVLRQENKAQNSKDKKK